jgi:hypothetical protein
MVAIGFEEFPCFAWRGIASSDIAKRPIYLAITVKLSILCIAHLANSEM